MGLTSAVARPVRPQNRFEIKLVRNSCAQSNLPPVAWQSDERRTLHVQNGKGLVDVPAAHARADRRNVLQEALVLLHKQRFLSAL